MFPSTLSDLCRPGLWISVRPKGQGVPGEFDRLHGKRQADDRDREQDSGEQVAKREPDAREEQPDQVEQEPHSSAFLQPIGRACAPGGSRICQQKRAR